jgi:hypothetical protein
VRFVIALLVLAWTSVADARPSLHFAARSGRVTVFSERGLEDTAQELADSAEATLTRIAGDLVGMPVPDQIEVRLVTEASDLASIAPQERGAPPWAIGVAYPDLGIISVATRRGAQVEDPAATLRHELAHVALGVALGPSAPRWLHEGFAYQHSREWSMDRVETLAGMAWVGGAIPLDQLDASFPEQEVIAHRAYAESYDFVGFLSRRGRWEDHDDDGDRWPFRRFLAAIGSGANVDAAARLAYGKPIKELFGEWQSDLDRRYMLIPIGLFGLAIWIFCAFLLVLAWLRRRRMNRRRIAQWEREEAFTPHFDLDHDPDDEPVGPAPEPRLMN